MNFNLMENISMDEKSLIGKEIKEIEVDGYQVYIKFTDNTILDYSASDAGYSAWTIIDGDNEDE